MLFVRWMMNGLNMTKNVICGVLESLRKFKTQLMISVCDALFSVSHDIKRVRAHRLTRESDC